MPRKYPSLETLAARHAVQHNMGKAEAAKQLRKRLYSRYGKKKAKLHLDQAHSTFRLMTGA